MLWRYSLLGTGALVAIALGVWLAPESGVPAATAQRTELELRDGVLFRPGTTAPFSGWLIEEWRPGRRRTEVAIREGRAHGLSRGYFENGRLESEETFVRGVSHGRRTRWFENGAKKSQVEIRAGRLVGVFREWHPNGQLAREAPLVAGVAHGEVRGWDRHGRPAGVARVEHGRIVQRD